MKRFGFFDVKLHHCSSDSIVVYNSVSLQIGLNTIFILNNGAVIDFYNLFDVDDLTITISSND